MYLQGNTLPLTPSLPPQRPHFLLLVFSQYSFIYENISEFTPMRLKPHDSEALPLNVAPLETKPSTHKVSGLFQIQTIISRVEGLIDNLGAQSSKPIEENTRFSPDMNHPKKNHASACLQTLRFLLPIGANPISLDKRFNNSDSSLSLCWSPC